MSHKGTVGNTMTEQEDHALSLFIQIVAELNDAQEMLNIEMRCGDVGQRVLAKILSNWMESLRGGASQEYLNELAMVLIQQEDE